MAYGLKYSQYLEKGGATLQIRVYVDGWSGASYGMAHLTGASLQLIGGQADILAPYIKTSFSFSLADCWDEGATKADGTTCVNAQNEKCGRWEEFYTPDATKFRVELWAKATPSATAARIWQGYVTPDSWSENMIYRGTVTITARDMLGALQDKEFDLTGRVSVLDIVQGALSACHAPMPLSYTAGHFLVNENGSSILSHTVAASTFAGDTWQTVLQDTLESLGLTLRYNGHDALVLTSLRYIAADTTSGSHTIEYINRSGLRELDPALKYITETFDVDVVELSNPDPASSQYAATGSNLTQKIVAHLSGGGTQTSTNYIPGYTLTESGGEGWSGTLAVPALGTIVDGAADRSIYFPTDIQETVAATLHLPRMRGYFAFKMEQDGGLMEIGTRTGVGTVIRPCTSGHSISEVRVRVEAVVSGTTKYLSSSGTWGTTSTDFGIEIGQEVIVPDPGAVGIKIVVVKVITENTMPAYYSIIAALKVTVSPGAEGASIISEYKTTTRYDDANNVTITRRPAIGSASLDGCVDFFQNVLALGDAIAADRWNWPGASSYYPLAVMIQAQALCYYAAAASVFTGTAHDKAAELALPGCGYGYYDRACVAVSATYDFGGGFIVQTNLREYYTWESVWGTFSPDYSEASGSGRGSTSATGASGASVNPGSGSGGTGGGGGVNYFQINGTLASLVELKDQYTYLGPKGGLFFSGATLSGTPTPDLYVDTVQDSGGNPVRVLRTPLALITGSDQIVVDGTPGGGGGGGATNLKDLEDVYHNASGVRRYSSGNVGNTDLLGYDSTKGWYAVQLGTGLSMTNGVLTASTGSTYTAGYAIAIAQSAISVAHTNEDADPISFDPDTHTGLDASNLVEWGTSAHANCAKLTVGVGSDSPVSKDLVLASGYDYLLGLINSQVSGVSSVAGKTGAVTLEIADVTGLQTALNGKQAAGNYLTSVPLATSDAIGGIQLGYTQSGKTYPVQLSSGKAYVSVPWENTTYSNATTSAAGLMSADDKSKLNGIAANANNYSLPTASSSTLGGIKIGTGLTIDSSGVVSVTGQTQGTVTRVDVGSTQYSPSSAGVVSLPAYPTTLPASDVYSWAKASSKPSYAFSEITGSAAISQVSGLQTALDGKQPLDSDLTAIAAISTGTGLLKRSVSGTTVSWSIDTNTYLTGNQTITLSGDVSGSGATSITTTIGEGKVTNAMLAGGIENSKLNTIGVAKGGTGLTTWTGAYRLVYSTAATTLTTLAPNSTTTRKFLRQVGANNAATAPAWDTVTKTDVGLGNVPNWAVTSIDTSAATYGSSATN